MSDKTKQEAKPAGSAPRPGKKPPVEYGEPRPEGVAGPDAAYVQKSLQRWRLRGPGIMR
ncbi:MAG: hypothetical protein AB1814_13590 [Thermodesulfobacteriota bacterium]